MKIWCVSLMFVFALLGCGPSDDGQQSGRFSAGDAGISTNAGQKTADGRLVTTGKDGYLMYGPYLRWAAGTYKLSIFGQHTSGPATFDVVHDGGRQILAARTVTKVAGVPAAEGTMPVMEMEFTVPAAVSDLEVRAAVTSQTALSITSYEVSPVQSRR